MGKRREKERDVPKERGRRVELNPRGQRDISFTPSIAVQPLSPLVIPPASVWEILQVKLQALHFRPLQSLSTGYLSFTVQLHPRLALSASSFRIGAEAGETLETKRFIHAFSRLFVV